MKITNPIKLVSVWMMSILIAIMLTSLVLNATHEKTKYVVISDEKYQEIYGMEVTEWIAFIATIQHLYWKQELIKKV